MDPELLVTVWCTTYLYEPLNEYSRVLPHSPIKNAEHVCIHSGSAGMPYYCLQIIKAALKTAPSSGATWLSMDWERIR